MKKWIKISLVFFIGLIMGVEANAQYQFEGPNRYYYEEEFDWRWDLRVRISEGYNMGYLSRRQANRLYKRLEAIERKEWAYQSDGYYSVWEQDDVWMDLVDLNRRLGIMLTSWDKPYYGYRGVVIAGPLRWYYGPTYDFYRFDKRGYGTIYIGYTPRAYYPVKTVYYNINKTYVSNWTNPAPNTTTTSRRTEVSSSRVGQSQRTGSVSGSRTTVNSNNSSRVVNSTRATTTTSRVQTDRNTVSTSAPSARKSTASRTTTGSTSRVSAPTRSSSASVNTARTATPTRSMGTTTTRSSSVGTSSRTSSSSSSTARVGTTGNSRATTSNSSAARIGTSSSSRAATSSTTTSRTTTSRSTGTTSRTPVRN